MDWENQNVRLALAAVAGIIIGFAAHWIIVRPEPAVAPDVIDHEDISLVGTNGALARDQVAGKAVVLEKVVLENVGWVAIHDDMDGMPGRILGAQLFDKGEHMGAVELLRATVPDTNYFVVVHTDDGDYKHFNPKTDTILNDQAGRPIMSSFKTGSITATSSVSVGI